MNPLVKNNAFSPYAMFQPPMAFGNVMPFIQTDTGTSSFITSGGATRDETLGFGGFAMSGSKISVFDNNNFLGYADIANGSWRFVTTKLDQGFHDFRFEISFLGQTSKTNLFATIDSIAPEGPFSNTIVTDTGSTQITDVGVRTTDRTLGLNGTAEAGSVVQIYDNGNFLGFAERSDTTWFFNTQRLANGQHSFSSVITDAVGNDTHVQGATAEVYSGPIGTLATAIQTDTGATTFIENGDLTKDNSLSFSGTMQPGAFVIVFDGAQFIGQAFIRGFINGSESWTFTTPRLQDGTHNFHFTISNGQETTSLDVNATIDTVAEGTFVSDVDDGERTTAHIINLSGTTEVGSVVQIFDNDSFIGNALVNGTDWSFSTETLTDGNHALTSHIIDLAKNETTLAGVTAEVYTEAPVMDPHVWSNTTGWGGVDALAAINYVTHQSLADVSSEPYTIPWGIEKANMDDAWSYGYTGKGITVAVIDTGLNLSNNDLIQNLSSWNWDFVNNDSDVSDDNGHGTFVASEIISANDGYGLTGAAYDAELMVLKVLGSDGSGSAEIVAKAIVYAVDHGANIINLSLGSVSNYDGYGDAISYANEHNVLVVMSAGNNAGDDPIYPAYYAKNNENAIAVGALNINYQFGTQSVASFSNHAGEGPYAFLDAAGQEVWGYGLKDDDILTWAGTSMAAPYVAAAAALVWAADESLTAVQVAQALTHTSYSVI